MESLLTSTLEYLGILKLKKQVLAIGRYLSGSASEELWGAVNLNGIANSLADEGRRDLPEQKFTNCDLSFLSNFPKASQKYDICLNTIFSKCHHHALISRITYLSDRLTDS